MIPDSDNGVEISYTIHLFFIFSLCSYFFVDTNKTLELLLLLLLLKVNLGTPKLLCQKLVCWCWKYIIYLSPVHAIKIFSTRSVFMHDTIILKIEENSMQNSAQFCYFFNLRTQTLTVIFHALHWEPTTS